MISLLAAHLGTVEHRAQTYSARLLIKKRLFESRQILLVPKFDYTALVARRDQSSAPLYGDTTNW